MLWSGLPSWAEVPALLWSGASIGAIGALLGIGVVLSLRATGVMNLAIGAFYVLGALAYHDLTAAGVPVGLAAAITVGVGGVTGFAEEAVVLRPLRRSPPSILMLGTIAFSVLVSGALAVVVGRDFVNGPPLLTGTHRFGTAFVSWAEVLLVLVAFVVGVVVTVWSRRSQGGLRLAAVADDADAAVSIGIDVASLRRWMLVVVGAMCALVGVLSTPIVLIDVNASLSAAVMAFVAAVVGGGRSALGTLAGGVAVGLIESFGARMFSNSIANAITAAVLVALVAGAARLPALRSLATR